jgi:hypothetical protein
LSTAILTGVRPASATPCSPPLKASEPKLLVSSTSPSIIVTVVRPSGPTKTLNSVPRIAPVTVGVRIWTSCGRSRLKK